MFLCNMTCALYFQVPKEPIILPSVMGIQDPGLMGFHDGGINGMPPVGGMQSVSTNSMQPHASSSFMPNTNSVPIPPPTQVPFYQPPLVNSQPSGQPLTNGNTNTLHYGNQFYDNSYHPPPSYTENSSSFQSHDFSSNRLALHSHSTPPLNRYSSANSLDNVSLDKELPDLGQLNSPLFSDASYNHNVIANPFCSASSEFSNLQSPATSGTSSLTSSFDIGRKRSGCSDILPNSKHLKPLPNIPTPYSQEIDNGLDIFSNQTTPHSTISASNSVGTPDSFSAPCISSNAIPDHFSFKHPSCDTLDFINAATSSCSSSETNYWSSFDGFDPSLTPEDLLVDPSVYVTSQKAEEQLKQRKLDALDILESLAQSKNDSVVSPNTDKQSSSRDDVSLKSHSGSSLVAGAPFRIGRTSESYPVESVLNEDNYDPVDDNEVFECKNDTTPSCDTDQSNQDIESQQSAQESMESTSDSSPIRVRNSILSSTDGQIIPRSRFYSSHCSDLLTPLSVSSRFSCSSPVDNSQASGRITPVSVAIPPEVVAHEYMKKDPLLPPSPPPVNEELDLHPDVPIIEVSRSSLCLVM